MVGWVNGWMDGAAGGWADGGRMDNRHALNISV